MPPKPFLSWDGAGRLANSPRIDCNVRNDMHDLIVVSVPENSVLSGMPDHFSPIQISGSKIQKKIIYTHVKNLVNVRTYNAHSTFRIK